MKTTKIRFFWSVLLGLLLSHVTDIFAFTVGCSEDGPPDSAAIPEFSPGFAPLLFVVIFLMVALLRRYYRGKSA